MAKSNTEIPSNFIEDDYISAIDRILGKASGISPNIEICRISQHSEGDLGYDGILNSIVPYYIQFKIPTYFTPKYSGKLKRDRKSFKKKDINGFLAFKLRLDPKSKNFDQHNALFRLSFKHKAVYVCPKFYKKNHLSDLKSEEYYYPWKYGDIMIYNTSLINRLSKHVFKNVKIFSSSITIPVHKKIADGARSHFFSFNQSNETIFHSDPELLDDYPIINLSDFLYQLVNEYTDFKEEMENDLNAFPNNIIQEIPELFELPWNSPILRELIHSELLFLGIRYNTNQKLDSQLRKLELKEKLTLLEIILKKYFNIHQYLVFKYNF